VWAVPLLALVATVAWVCNGSFYDSAVNSDPQSEFQLDEWNRMTAILAAAASNSGLPGAGIAHRW
jgi:hypothetical protein